MLLLWLLYIGSMTVGPLASGSGQTSIELNIKVKEVEIGSSVILECDLNYPKSSLLPKSIKWSKQDRISSRRQTIFYRILAFTPWLHSSFAHRLSVQNGATLNLKGVKLSDTGIYYCEVEFEVNKEKEVQRQVIGINVFEKPTIYDHSPSETVREVGQVVQLFCSVRGSPPPRVTWFVGSRMLLSRRDPRITITSEQGDTEAVVHMLKVTNLRFSDGGVYRCEARNEVGAAHYSTRLLLRGGLVIIKAPPKNESRLEGQRLHWPCVAMGESGLPITYRWLFNGRELNQYPALVGRFRTRSNAGDLELIDLRHLDTGQFACEASTGEKVTRSTVDLTVVFRPRARFVSPRVVYLVKDQPGRVSCPLLATPALARVLWRRKESALNEWTSRPPTATVIAFRRVKFSDGGVYQCRGVNEQGLGDWSPDIHVIVKRLPYFVRRPRDYYQVEAGQTAMMRCEPAGDPPLSVVWKTEDGMDVNRLGHRFVVTNKNLTINTVRLEDKGKYHCLAKNPVATIFSQTELIVETETAHKPYNLSVTAHMFSADLQWRPAFEDNRSLRYIVYYRLLHASSWRTVRVHPPTVCHSLLMGLLPDEWYVFTVVARNRQGHGMFADQVHARTVGYRANLVQVLPRDRQGNAYFPPVVRRLGPQPPPPRSPQVNLTAEGPILMISWRAPVIANTSLAPILYYRVEFNTEGDDWTQLSPVVAGITNISLNRIPKHAELTHTLRFRVRSFALLSYSSPSAVVLVPPAWLDLMTEAALMSEDYGPPMVWLIVGILIGLTLLTGLALAGHRFWRQRRYRAGEAEQKYTSVNSNFAPKPLTCERINCSASAGSDYYDSALEAKCYSGVMNL